MQNLFQPVLDMRDVNAVSALGLAHLGDAVYELLVRTMLVTQGRTTGAHLHHDTISIVCAPAQRSRRETISAACRG